MENERKEKKISAMLESIFPELLKYSTFRPDLYTHQSISCIQFVCEKSIQRVGRNSVKQLTIGFYKII